MGRLRRPLGGPDVELLVSGFAALLACASLGFLVGRVAPSVVTAPLVALALYGAMGALIISMVLHPYSG